MTLCRFRQIPYGSQEHHPVIQRNAAWYAKPTPVFVDAIAPARRRLWITSHAFSMPTPDAGVEKAPGKLYARLIDSPACDA